MQIGLSRDTPNPALDNRCSMIKTVNCYRSADHVRQSWLRFHRGDGSSGPDE